MTHSLNDGSGMTHSPHENIASITTRTLTEILMPMIVSQTVAPLKSIVPTVPTSKISNYLFPTSDTDSSGFSTFDINVVISGSITITPSPSIKNQYYRSTTASDDNSEMHTRFTYIVPGIGSRMSHSCKPHFFNVTCTGSIDTASNYFMLYNQYIYNSILMINSCH